MSTTDVPEELLRHLTPQVLGALARRCGDFSAAEDAVQEALLAAVQAWPRSGVPANPVGWLIRVAQRRLIDDIRSDAARRAREVLVAVDPTVPGDVAGNSRQQSSAEDDTLTLLMLCAHPCLGPASAIALTLRAVGGLTTAQIAAAFLVPESTMGQRISRAKQSIRAAGARFEPPAPKDRRERVRAVLAVVYLMFNEAYVSHRDGLDRPDLALEALRIARLLVGSAPGDPEAVGLLSLLLLTHARRPARTDHAGRLVPLDEQDRRLWDAGMIEEGHGLLLRALGAGAVGPYQVQAAIAALHDEASSAEATDWPQISALYTLLERMAPGPMVTLNRAIAVGMVSGPQAALTLLDGLEILSDHHRLHAVRAHLLERIGRLTEARSEFERAAGLTANTAEHYYLITRAAQLARGDDGGR
ncbi:sigma-70 family RNA polymerase sigma factor [Arthrobacter sp. Br18]|uniref:RNA polymerase sigma factor n=1 Tax=Arthrobacter sp. Br18 TaxID=1312954 RepID=UPI0004786B89|nr:sigma-70 family RNA polymerase sigma factor [Arthrobacter sp. Br18]